MERHPPPRDAPVTARPATPQPIAYGLHVDRPSLELAGLSRGSAALDLMLVVLVAVTPYLGAMLASAFVSATEPPIDAPMVLVIQKWFELLVAGGLLAYLVFRHGTPAAGFGLHRRDTGMQFVWGMTTLILIYIGLMATALVAWGSGLLHEPQEELAQRMRFVRQMPVHDLGTSVLLLTPVALQEEIIFRALLIPLLRRVSGSWTVALLGSTLLFAALHVPQQGWLGGLQVFGVGAVLGGCFILSRSFVAVAVAHFLFNLVQFQLIRLIPFINRLAENAEAAG